MHCQGLASVRAVRDGVRTQAAVAGEVGDEDGDEGNHQGACAKRAQT
jgi:hypothetical protein